MGPGSANGKIEQRFLVGTGAREYSFTRPVLSPADRQLLWQFWQTNQGGYGSFTYAVPLDDGSFTNITARFKDPSITFEYALGCIANVGLTIVEIPTTSPTYEIGGTSTRFPTDIEDALSSPVLEIIPLVKIQAKEVGYPAIYLSDRLCTVGDFEYQPRLLDFDGIDQGLGGESDIASFTFGDADRVMTRVANSVDLFLADLEFSLFVVSTGTKIDLWKGEISDWRGALNNEQFSIVGSDGFHQLNQMHPRRKVSRRCWKVYNNAANGCPFATEGTLYTIRNLFDHLDDSGHPVTREYSFAPDAGSCDKGFFTPNGCLAHGMESRHGGIVANPQTVRTKDNSTGTAGFGRAVLTSASMVSDTVYNEVVPEIYCKITNEDTSIGFPVKAKIIAGRDEGDFYSALAIVGEGPVGEYAQPNNATGYNPHKLDGQDHHGWVSPQRNNYGLRLGNITGEMGTMGADPVPEGEKNNFSLGQGGEGIQYYGPERAAGTAFADMRRTDTKGLQISRLEEHSMEISLRQGLGGYVWHGAGDRELIAGGLINPIWICVNLYLRARGLQFADAETQETAFDVESAVNAAAICDTEVAKLIGEGNEAQFTFNGIMQEQKPVRDWIQEILNGCLGYFTFSFGKLRFGIRANSSAVEAWSDGNVIWGSFQYEPIKPNFNKITGLFADEEYGFQSNSVEDYSEENALYIGGGDSPIYKPATINFAGLSSKSAVARVIATRLREELGGYRPETFRAARRGSFKTTLMGLTVEPGTICRFDHPDMPDLPGSLPDHADPQAARSNSIEFRVQRWKLNKDFSVDIEWTSTHNEIYDLVAGPKPADVDANVLPTEEQFPPADWRFNAYTTRDGNLRFNRIAVGTNGDSVHVGKFDIYYVEETTNRYGTITADIDADDTSIGYAGTPPIIGEPIMLDAELMYVESVTPGAPNFGSATVRRGYLGTKAVPHVRVGSTVTAIDSDNPRKITVGSGVNFRPGSRIVVNDGGGPPYDQQGIASYDIATGVMYLNLPAPTLGVSDPLYSDVRLWRVQKRQEVVNFQPRFFRSPSRAKWEHVIDFPHAGVVLISAKLENTRGISSAPVIVFPTSPDTMEPQAVNDYIPAFPHRIRTLGEHSWQFQQRSLASGETEGLFTPVRTMQAQTFEHAYAEVAGGASNIPLDTPPGVSSLISSELQGRASITIGGTVDDDALVHVTVTGANEMSVQVWVERDHEGIVTTGDCATSLRDWLNGDPHFAAYYQAEAAASVVTITDKIGIGGTVAVNVAGLITAEAAGFTSGLGITLGRKYAVAYRSNGDGLLSSLSPLSASTGPTGGAQSVEIKDIPIPSDDRIDEVWVFATPDGQDSPFFRVAVVPAGTTYGADTTLESELTSQQDHTGPLQPPKAGDVLVSMFQDGNPWFDLFIPANKARSNMIHGFALDPLDENIEITANVSNDAGSVDLTVILQ
jgi:hypothetical protein